MKTIIFKLPGCSEENRKKRKRLILALLRSIRELLDLEQLVIDGCPSSDVDIISALQVYRTRRTQLDIEDGFYLEYFLDQGLYNGY